MSTTEKLAKALREILGEPDRTLEQRRDRWARAREAIAAHEADKQRESEDERRTFERAYEQICLGPWAGTMEMAWQVWQAGRASAQAVPSADALAQFIRTTDGAHSLGAGALAEKICEWLAAAPKGD
jgi:hypothetical protein